MLKTFELFCFICHACLYDLTLAFDLFTYIIFTCTCNHTLYDL